jgi:hypothetical protein
MVKIIAAMVIPLSPFAGMIRWLPKCSTNISAHPAISGEFIKRLGSERESTNGSHCSLESLCQRVEALK